MATARSKKPAQVVVFEKPPDRARTVPELEAPRVERSHRVREGRTTVEIPAPAVKNGAGELSAAQIAEMAQFGHQLFESGKVAEAKVVFEGLVALGVEDAFPHTMLGILYYAQKDSRRALALFEAALGFDPEDRAARFYRAELRLRNGRVKQALGELGRIARGTDAFADRARTLIDASPSTSSVSGRRRRRTR